MSTRRHLMPLLALLGGVCAPACSNENVDGASPQERATLEVKDYVGQQLDGLVAAAEALQEAAPEPDDDGWNPEDDAQAVDDMRASWADARDAYERVEGAIAVLFPNLDVSTDERYDGFIEAGGDDNLFDDEGVTGMHGIERILWADAHPQRVIDFESQLPGYQQAAFPATEEEADDFKNRLCQRLLDEVSQMREDFQPLALDAATAFRGVIGSLEEQLEKVTLAATAEDESRYAQRTLDDMRANLEGGREAYAAFQPWVVDAAGADVDEAILEGLDEIEAAYDDNPGAAIPEVPEAFDPDEPSDADLETPYGQLWSLLSSQTDPESTMSLVSQMLGAAADMGIPELPQ